MLYPEESAPKAVPGEYKWRAEPFDALSDAYENASKPHSNIGPPFNLNAKPFHW